MNYPVVLVLSSCSQTSALDVIASELKGQITDYEEQIAGMMDIFADNKSQR